MAGRAGGSRWSAGGWRVLVLILAAILAPHGASGGVHFVAPSVADVAGSNAGVVIHGSNFFQHTLTACRLGAPRFLGRC